MIKKTFIISILMISLLLASLFALKNLDKNNYFKRVVLEYTPNGVKKILKNTIFIFSENIKNRELIKERQSTIEILNLKVKKVMSDHYRDIYNEALNLGYIPVSKINFNYRGVYCHAIEIGWDCQLLKTQTHHNKLYNKTRDSHLWSLLNL